MAVFKRDIVDINLETGNIHRTFLQHSIGLADNGADHFGIRVYRDGEEVDLTGVSVQGYFRNPQGTNIAITSGNIVSGNEAEVVLPQACYAYEGQFCLAIKLVGGGVTGTIRIVDGMVDNANTGSVVAPTETVPTYQEVLAVYADMVECIDDFEDYKDQIDGEVGDLRSALVPNHIVNINSVCYKVIDSLPVSDGYWKGDGTITPSTTTFHCEKTDVDTNDVYVIYCQSSGNHTIRYFNGSGGVVTSRQVASGEPFNPVTNIMGINTTEKKSIVLLKNADVTTDKELENATNKITTENVGLARTLVFTPGYWDGNGNIVDSSTTFHTIKIKVIKNKKYRIISSGTIESIGVRKFNASKVFTGSETVDASFGFTATDEYVAINTLAALASEFTILALNESVLPTKSEVPTYKRAYSTGDTVTLANITETGIYAVYGGATVTDRPSILPTGGFLLYVTALGNGTVPQIIYPFTSGQVFLFRATTSYDWRYINNSANAYVGKTISIIGDSLSDKANSTAAVRFYDVIDEHLGTISIEYAASGCGYARKFNNGDTFYEQAAKISTTTDLVLIFGSFNDHNVYDTEGLGEITDKTTSTVFGCVYQTLQTIFNRAPKAAVGIILPTPWGAYPPYNLNTLAWDYVNGIKEIAKMYSIPVLDLYSGSNMRPWDETFCENFYKENGVVDDGGVHPSSAGHKRFAPMVEEFVKSILEQVD